MRILAVLAILATLGWCGYWYVGARGLDRGITTALERVPEFTASSHSVRGFPNRFDVTLSEPRYAANGIGWSAPFVQLFALSYRLNHLIAVFAHDQRLVAAGTEALLRSEDLRASLVLEAGLNVPLERFSLVGQQLELAVAGQTHRTEGLRAASRRQSERTHELVLLLETVFPDTAMLDRLDPARNWPRRFDVLRLDAEVEVTRILDRTMLDGPDPQIQRLTLTGAHVAWPGTDVIATGRLTPNAAGLLSGDVGLTVTGWRALMQSARSAGLMPAEHDALITMAMQGLISADDSNRIEAAFAVTDGAVYLGPILVGRIPAIY